MQMNNFFFINEEVDGIDCHRYKYIERDSTFTCSLCGNNNNNNILYLDRIAQIVT